MIYFLVGCLNWICGYCFCLCLERHKPKPSPSPTPRRDYQELSFYGAKTLEFWDGDMLALKSVGYDAILLDAIVGEHRHMYWKDFCRNFPVYADEVSAMLKLRQERLEAAKEVAGIE